MVRYRKVLNICKSICLILFIWYFFIGCKNTEVAGNYTFGVLYSNSVFDKTKISLFDDTGEILDTKKTKYTGITYSAFMDRAQSIDNYVYFSSPMSGNSLNDFILQFNKETLESKEIKSSAIGATTFTVDDTYAYIGNSGVEDFNISKVNIETGEEEYYIEGLSGNMIRMTAIDDMIYALTIKYTETDKTLGYLNIFKKDDFSLVKKIEIEDIGYSEDIAYKDGYIYLVQSLKSRSEEGDNLVRVDIDTEEVTNITLPFKHLNQIHIDDDFIYVTQGSLRKEITDKQIAKISINTLEIEVFDTEIDNFISFLKDNKLYTSDGNLIQMYDLKNFDKIDEFSIESDEQFTTFYIK